MFILAHSSQGRWILNRVVTALFGKTLKVNVLGPKTKGMSDPFKGSTSVRDTLPSHIDRMYPFSCFAIELFLLYAGSCVHGIGRSGIRNL